MDVQDTGPPPDLRIIHWLLRDGPRITDSTAFLKAFAEEPLANGVEIARVSTGVPILHPQVFSFSGLRGDPAALQPGRPPRLWR